MQYNYDPSMMVAWTTAQKINFRIKDFFSKCDQIRSFLQIWSHLLKKSLMENFIFCAMSLDRTSVLYTEALGIIHVVLTRKLYLKLTFLPPSSDTRMRICAYQGKRNVSFSEGFRYLLCSLT